jgi:hypothetical protein
MPEWGGHRPGAGRKPKEPGRSRVTLSTRVSDACYARLKRYATDTHKSLGEVLDELIAFASDHPEFEAILAGEPVEATLAIVPPQPDQPEPVRPVDFAATVGILMDNLRGSAAFLDREAILRLVNQEFQTLLGGQEDLIGKSCHDALAHAIGDIDTIVQGVLAGGPAQRAVCCGLGSFGDRCFELRVVPFGEPASRGVVLSVAVVPVPAVGQEQTI